VRQRSKKDDLVERLVGVRSPLVALTSVDALSPHTCMAPYTEMLVVSAHDRVVLICVALSWTCGGLLGRRAPPVIPGCPKKPSCDTGLPEKSPIMLYCVTPKNKKH